ncbi:MAG: hypothetical protein N2255_02715 [Kiritimatiellae bacterium]|nr:hypothetical protein [Kiritimatiellia bacterium]
MRRDLSTFFNVDRRVIFLFVFLTILLPMIFPFSLPIRATKHVRDVYESFAASAAEGKPVLLALDFDPTARAELEPAARAMLRQIFASGGKVVMTGILSGMSLHEQIIADCAQEYGAVYGRDYVYLGFQPGGPALIINMGQDFVSAYPRDAYGRDIRTMEATCNILTLRDFGYVMVFAAGLGTVVNWINLGQGPYSLRLGAAVTGVIAPDLYNYLDSRQLTGMLGGLVGVAQYEQLLKDKGMYLVRRFSPLDFVSSRIPDLCRQLIPPHGTKVGEYIWNRLQEETRQAVMATVEKRYDQLTRNDKKVLAEALNEAIEKEDTISEADLERLRLPEDVRHLLDVPSVGARRSRVLRRLYLEELWAPALVHAQSDAQAVRWMTPQSVTHLVLIIAIVLGNVCYFVDKRRKTADTKNSKGSSS